MYVGNFTLGLEEKRTLGSRLSKSEKSVAKYTRHFHKSRSSLILTIFTKHVKYIPTNEVKFFTDCICKPCQLNQLMRLDPDIIVVVNAAFLFFETSKLWALIMYICRIDGKPKD